MTAPFISRLARWVRKNYGPRCRAFQPGCPACAAWGAHDVLALPFHPAQERRPPR